MANLPTFVDRVTILNAENLNKLNTAITANENNISTNMANISENVVNISSNDYDITNLEILTDNLSSLQDDYLLLNGSRSMTGVLNMGNNAILNPERIRISVDNLFLKLQGGLSPYSPFIALHGKDYQYTSGAINFLTTGSGGTSIKDAGKFEGMSDTPYLLLYHGLKTDTISEKTAGAGITIDGCIIKDGKTQETKLMPFYLKNLSSTEYLLGTGVTDTMYPFNETVFITNYVITYNADTNSKIDVEFADINGSWHSNSLTQSAAGGYQDNKSFTTRIVDISNKLQIKLDNVSNINYMNFVLNYK